MPGELGKVGKEVGKAIKKLSSELGKSDKPFQELMKSNAEMEKLIQGLEDGSTKQRELEQLIKQRQQMMDMMQKQMQKHHEETKQIINNIK